MKRPESLLEKFPSPENISIEKFNTCLNVLYINLTRGEKVHTRNGAVANGYQSLVGLHVDTGKTVEVLEESAVGGAHSQLYFRQLW